MERCHELERVLAPTTLTSFEDVYFEKKPLLISRNESTYFRDLLSIELIDEYLERKDIRYPSIRLVKDGLELPQTDYLKSFPFGNQSFDRVVDNDRLFTLFGDGATMVFQALHRTISSLSLFCQNIEQYFNFPLQTNIYLTPKSSQGFAAHFDNHDVFILQAHGTKIWKVYDSPVYLPTKPFDKKNWITQSPQIEVELKEGDTMYIPRGFVHEAVTTTDVSLHITLGLLTYTWIDIYRQLTDSTHRIDGFRESFRFDRQDEKSIKENTAKLFDQLLKSADFASIRNEFQNRLIKKGLTSDTNRLNDILNYDKINSKSSLSLRQEINFQISKMSTDISLTFYNKKLTFPSYVLPTLTTIINSKYFVIDNLQSELDDSGKLTLCKKLVREGFLKLNATND